MLFNILIASGCYNCSRDCKNIDIKVSGRYKIALIGLGPVTLGCTSGCACQPDDRDCVVNIRWTPSDAMDQNGARPTLSITTINTLADAITPFQSYSSKFRITGSIIICNANCEGLCDYDKTCSFNRCPHHSSSSECYDECDSIGEQSSGSGPLSFNSDMSESFSSHSYDSYPMQRFVGCSVDKDESTDASQPQFLHVILTEL